MAFAAALLVHQAQAAESLDRVEITGSSIKRIDAETALPVQVLKREDIARSGVANVEQLMQSVTAMASSGGNLVSAASGATTGSISSVSLRGLSSLRTLVLVNGRRLSPYGIGFTNDSVSVDINSIPLAAIERVEILKDGASSVYGSDAIAGVVNFILRVDYRGTEGAVGLGMATQGGAGMKRASLLWGRGDLPSDSYNLMLLASAQQEDGLFGRERAFARHAYDVAAGNDTTSGNTFPANIAAADGSFGSHNPTAATGCVAPYSFIDPLRSAASCRFDTAPLVSLVPAVKRVSLFGALRFKLGAQLEGLLEAGINRNENRTVIQPVPLSDQFNLPANNVLYNLDPYRVPGGISASTILLKAGSPYYPTAFVQRLSGGPTPDLLVRYRAALSGNRDITDIATSPRATLGLRGELAGWDIDTALLRSESRVREHNNDGWPILSKLLPLLNSGRVNFFGDNTPDITAQIRGDNFVGDAFSVHTALTSWTGRASREVFELPGGPAAIALGAELRSERYDFRPSQALAEGDIAGYGGNIAATNRSRRVDAVFGEVNLPVIKGLELNAAVRLDRYGGVGSSTTPKLSLRWQPVHAVLVRAAVGRGFRAPSLADLYTPPTTGVTTQGQTDPLRCPTTNDGIKDCQTQFATTNGGNDKLKAEKSRNGNLGLVLEPAQNLSLSADLFRISLFDTISNGLTPSFILGDLGKFGVYVQRGPVDPAFPALPGPIVNIDQRNLNTGRTEVRGADFDARWRLALGSAGRLALAFSGTYFDRFDSENPDGSFSAGVSQVGPAGGIIPRLKTYQAATWSTGPVEATLALNYQRGYDDLPGALSGAARRVASYRTWDAQLGYAGWLPGMKWTLGLRNLLNTDPPYSNAGGQTSFQSGYDPQYADPRGRFIYVNASYAIH